MAIKDVYESYFDHLIHGHRVECRAILDDLINNQTPVQEIYTQLFQKSLYRVGDYWERNLISVAVEHIATAITESLMISIQPRLFTVARNGRRAVVACVANEYHQVGARMVADILELHGWDGYFLGSNTPVADLLKFIEKNNPDLIGLSLSIYFNLGEMIKTFETIRTHFPRIPVMVGGQAFRWGGSDLVRRYSDAYYLNSIHVLETFLTSYGS